MRDLRGNLCWDDETRIDHTAQKQYSNIIDPYR